MPRTSVVVSTYDEQRWKDLEACVASLHEQALPPLEVIVVVDHNPALLKRATESFPNAEVIENARPRGLAGARNMGARSARGEIVAFVDDDARTEPGWLEQLERCFDDDAVVGAGGALIPRWETAEPHWIPGEFFWVFGCSYTGLPEHRAPVRNPIGANMAVRASVLSEVDGFREGDSQNAPSEIRSRGFVRAAGNIPDDTDLAIRVSSRLPSAVWLYEPGARVLHTVTAERTSLSYFLRRCYEEGVGKANLSRYVGAGEGLRSERRHLFSAIPRACARELGSLFRGDPHAALRFSAILLGVFTSGAGFLATRLRPASDRAPQEPRS